MRASQRFRIRLLVQVRSGHRDRDSVPREIQIRGAIAFGNDHHSITRVRSSAALASHNDERFRKESLQRFQHARDAVGIGVVDEVHFHAVGRRFP